MPIKALAKGKYEMEELCYLLEQSLPIHCPTEQGKYLHYSMTTPLNMLAQDTSFISMSFNRYQKILNYTDMAANGDTGVMIEELMKDFLDSRSSTHLLLAVKIKNIDTLIRSIL